MSTHVRVFLNAQSCLLQKPNIGVSEKIEEEFMVVRLYTQSGQKMPEDFGIIFLTKAFSWKHLKEKCWSEDEQQLSLKYFANFRFIAKLFPKVWK